MKLTFIGTGYVGLVSGIALCHLGHNVKCVDLDQSKINKLKNFELPIFEEGLEGYLNLYGNTERLEFEAGYSDSLADSEAIFITVGTPELPDGQANLEYIFDAVLQVAALTRPDCLIVIKSTVPPQTGQKLKELLKKNGYTHEVASNPEFLREGTALMDFLNPDRVVIGCDSQRGKSILQKIYQPLLDQGTELVATDITTSELIKYGANSFLACKVAFINEFADLCELIGADVTTLSRGIGLDKRIGSSFLNAGPGFGGSCFPKDILALQHFSKTVQSDFFILDAVVKANKQRAGRIIEKIKNFMASSLQGKKIAIFGLTYKAGTDDLRSSPALEIINLLKQQGAEIVAYDPQGMKNTAQYFDELVCAGTPYLAAQGADLVIIATEWSEFTELDFDLLKKQMNSSNIVDLRNVLDKQKITQAGFKSFFIGQKT